MQQIAYPAQISAFPNSSNSKKKKEDMNSYSLPGIKKTSSKIFSKTIKKSEENALILTQHKTPGVLQKSSLGGPDV